MSPEVNTEPGLENAHVLFIDAVGYSKLLIKEQRELCDPLNRLVRSSEEFRKAEAVGKLVHLPTGGGIALVFADSPEEPARCASEISKALRGFPQLHLRMGIHSGLVSRVVDINDRTNIAGAAIKSARLSPTITKRWARNESPIAVRPFTSLGKRTDRRTVFAEARFTFSMRVAISNVRFGLAKRIEAVNGAA